MQHTFVRLAAVALILSLGFGTTASAQCPRLIDSTSLVGDKIEDDDSFTYAVGSAGVGTFAQCTITRKFAKPIQSLKLIITGGQADDIGYVGSQIVTSSPLACRGVGRVTGAIDVSSQVTITGDTATFTLAARENCCCFTGWGSATQGDRTDAQFHWVVTLGSQSIRAGTGSGPGSPGTVETGVTDAMPTAHFPLGSTFFVELIKKGTDGAPDTALPSAFSITGQNVADGTVQRAVFANRTILPYESTGGTVKYFQAVHLGTAVIRIVPTDPDATAVSLPVSIDPPASLGASHTEFDRSLIALSHAWGVPPQMLKAQVDKESSFVGRAYRYEPLSIDFEVFSPNGNNRRVDAPYSNFRLRTADGLTQGSELIDDDIAPRSRYSIVRNGVRRRIQSADELVSCREIFEQNDATIGWSSTSSQSRLNRIRDNSSLLNFTAQTPVAASYGWFQVLYTTAIGSGWQGISGHRNPSYLFDTTATLASNAGSISVAMIRLRSGFFIENRSQTANPSFPTRQTFDEAWQRGFNNYNHNFGAEASKPYGIRILALSHSYEPVAASAIFQ